MLGNQPIIEILILAAGKSSRLGQPKQLLQFKGTSLIQRITSESVNAEIGNVTVVTGHLHEAMVNELTGFQVDIFFNKEWEEGIGSSIRNGLRYLLGKNPSINAILITMVDQPFVDAIHLQKLANAYDPARPMIIASAYSGTFGVPVLVDNYYFEMLTQLQGDEGGKKIFVRYLKNIVEIPFIQGSIDIDEAKDLHSIR